MGTRQLNPASLGFPRGWWFRALGLAAAALLLGLPALRAQQEEPAEKANDKAAAAAAPNANKPPEPQEVTLTTRDGVTLTATYYPGTNGKESIPVVLLHGFRGSRKDYADLAPRLQEDLGCAVLVPDLRGHGDSTKTNGPKLDAAKMRPGQFPAMISQDMPAILDYLRDENNGQDKSPPGLNLNKLCIVGADMGAAVALGFAKNDWNTTPVGGWQMGTFTKALVLISPELSAHGLKIAVPLADEQVRSQISVMLLVGQNAKKPLDDATRVNNLLKLYHPLPEDAAKVKEQRSLFFIPVDTHLQGTKLLGGEGLGVAQMIEMFISRRLVTNPDVKSNKAYKRVKLRKNPYATKESSE